MKITIFIGGISGGGAERVACNLANFLSLDNDVTILTMSETENTYGLSSSVNIKSLVTNKERKNKITCNLLRFIRLKKHLKYQPCDTYVVMLPITTVLLLLLRKCTNAVVIATERCNPSSYSGFMQMLLKKLSVRADAWVFQTDDAKKWYGEGVKKVKVIPNAINTEFIALERFNGIRKKEIVSVGRLDSQKNFKLLIDAFHELSNEFPDYNLVIYGKGKLKDELTDIILKYGLKKRVFLPGYVSDIQDRLRESSLFVLSSDFEGMPNALMEAMALGLPSISTDCPCGGSAFLIHNNVNGVLVPVGDKKEMKYAIRKVLSDSSFADSLGKEAMKISDTLHPDKIYGMWKAFITEVANEKKN